MKGKQVNIPVPLWGHVQSLTLRDQALRGRRLVDLFKPGEIRKGENRVKAERFPVLGIWPIPGAHEKGTELSPGVRTQNRHRCSRRVGEGDEIIQFREFGKLVVYLWYKPCLDPARKGGHSGLSDKRGPTV